MQILAESSIARGQFNTLAWTGADNGFGHGLPPSADNSANWPFMKPLLANPVLKPSAADVQSATAQAQALLELRFSSPLFRLGSADAINTKVTFPVSGSVDAHPGVIVMRVGDTVGTDVDPALKGLVVVFNGSTGAVDQKLPGMAGANLGLSSVQSAGPCSLQAARKADFGAANRPGVSKPA